MRILGWLFYRSVQALGWIVRVCPLVLKKGAARLGARFWFYIFGFRTRILLLNLSFAFPRQVEESTLDFKKRIHSLAVENLYNYFLGIFEILEKTTWNYATLKKKIVLVHPEILEKATESGRGAFILTAHIGNWEVALSLAKLLNRPMSVIVRFVRNSFWDEVLKLSRQKFEVNLLAERSSGVSAVRAFKKGHLVAFILDQHTGEPHGLLAKFFGLNVWTAKGLAILSSRLRAPIVPAFSYRKDGKFYVEFEPVLDFSDLGDCKTEEQIQIHVQRCNDAIESWVRRHPEQYFWIHRRLKGHLNYRTESLPF